MSYDEYAADRTCLQAFMGAINAYEKGHSGRTLADHLLGTFDLLANVKRRREICLGGALHSIYGTNSFRFRSLPESARPQVRQLFGERAEELAWRFSGLDRPHVLNIGNGVGYLSPDTLTDLRIIEAANLLEQGCSLDRFPRIQQAWSAALEAAQKVEAPPIVVEPKEDVRGSGRTARQMLDAPPGATFVWNNWMTDYPKNLAKKLGREDLRVVSSDWIERRYFMGEKMNAQQLVVDHAASIGREKIAEAIAILQAG